MKTDRFQIHSNGQLRSVVTADGHGGLYHDWVALTRFSEAEPECSGPMIYLSETEDLSCSQEITVASDSAIEIRKITLTNHGAQSRDFELTTYTEIALNHPLGDAGHPAFSKLFVQTSIANDSVLLARRRPRGMNENWPSMGQTLISDATDRTWECYRAPFIGRGRELTEPAAMDATGPLSCETGNVLDPIMAWRVNLSLEANSFKCVWLITAAASDEKAVLDLIHQCDSESAATELFDASVANERERIKALGISQDAAARYDAMAETFLLGRADRTCPTTLEGSDIVHRYPLSWDEIRVVATGDIDSEATGDLIDALPYWRSLGLKVRIFVFSATIQKELPDNVTLVDPASFTDEQLAWWLASAQWVAGEKFSVPRPRKSRFVRPQSLSPVTSEVVQTEPLQHNNGYGGFSANGREYIIPMSVDRGRLHLPPMPWVNILANPNFGCMVTERGAGYTWSRNSQANRLTPWSNDPVRDPHGEALYMRDDVTGEIWSPLPGPCEPRSAFTVRHGFGYSTFTSNVHDITQHVAFLMPQEDSIKLVSVKLKNESATEKNLTFATYHQLMLSASMNRHHATLAWSDASGVQHAVNPNADDFSGGKVFAFVSMHGTSLVRDQSCHSTATFLGGSTMASPNFVAQQSHSAPDYGFGRDACFSRKLSFTLPPRSEIEIVIGFGEVMDEMEGQRLIGKYGSPKSIQALRSETDAYWHRMLGGVCIKTPLPEVDLMVNGWLLYQNLACRIWGRSAFYQSGGAFGFRDQLQDSGALAALRPELMRSQILLHAAQQFPEGDVTHWWHPAPLGSGMRTKFSDDLLWLPYLTDHYLNVTGDLSVLDESQPFLEGPLLKADEDEEYMKPRISEKNASVFEHCCLAIDKSLTRGKHGLPLMGIGDWNDGMSRIGRKGEGESVWMGFFLFTILNQWIPRCENRNDDERVKTYTRYRDELLSAINDAGWDGEWYRRAYYDDGTPLGTHTDAECRIDALAQAWAVISKAAPAERVEKSLDSLERELVDPEYDIIRLLHPPFVNTPNDPGYIKGYVAGVRENGGQYTHAACWVIRAMAEAGRHEEAANLLQHLSPIWHTRDQAAVARYQVEPYVVAADIYGAEPHNGRGGWTWYTGSAGWFFRVAVETILGLRVENGNTLVLDPKIPASWAGYTIDYRTPSGKTLYQIAVLNPDAVTASSGKCELDGKRIPMSDGIARWEMSDDGENHRITMVTGKSI